MFVSILYISCSIAAVIEIIFFIGDTYISVTELEEKVLRIVLASKSIFNSRCF
jgi:hypothetical protein